MLFKYLKRALAFAGLATAPLAAQPAAAQAAAASQSARPALWQVSDPDTTIYLFGTIHLLPANYKWQSRAIDRAIADSQTLYVETLVDQANPQALARELARLGYGNNLLPLASRINPAKRPLLEAAIAKSGIPRPLFDRMETWTAAFTLLGVQFKSIGLQGEHGVEQVLRQAFAASGKPVGQLETNSEQLGFFDTLPQDAQRALLEGAIDTPQSMSSDFNGMLQSWASGDVAAIAATFNEGLAASPALRAALLSRRNANWSNWIANRMVSPGKVLVAVGAGHLAGDESVLRHLETRGYKVKRLQ